MSEFGPGIRTIEPRDSHAAALGDHAAIPLLDVVLRKHGYAPFRIGAAGMMFEAGEAFYTLLRRPAPDGRVPFGQILSLLEPDAAASLSALALRAVKDGGGFAMVHRYRWPDGSSRLLEWEAGPGGGGSGELRLVGVVRDATAESEARNLLEGQRELIANLVDHVPLPVAILNARLQYVAVNRRWIDDFAVDDSQGLIGRHHYDLFPDTPIHWRELHHLALNGERITRDLDTFERASGARMTLNWVLQPWRDKTGGIGGIVIMAEILRVAAPARESADRSDIVRILLDVCAEARPSGAIIRPKPNPWLRTAQPKPGAPT